MKNIICNGTTYATVEDATQFIMIDRILESMDQETCDKAYEAIKGGSVFDLIQKYLEIAEEDLVIK